MPQFLQLFRISGSANSIVYDSGLISTEREPKRLLAVGLQMDAYAPTDDNDVQGYHERDKVFEIPEKMLPQMDVAATDGKTYAAPGIFEAQVNRDLPPGDTFKAAMKCAATATNLRGYYRYELEG